jgi:hypothetical protein
LQTGSAKYAPVRISRYQDADLLTCGRVRPSFFSTTGRASGGQLSREELAAVAAYRDRNPPWIKLHWALLSSRDWVALDDASRVLAIACMLVASRNEGLVPVDPTYIKRVAYLNQTPNFKPLIECGFLESASTMLADARLETEGARPETETETYKKETEKESTPSALPTWIPQDAWKAWLEVRRRIGAPNTEYALNLAIRKLGRYRAEGHDPKLVLEQAIERGWRGLFPVKRDDGTVAPVTSSVARMCAYCGHPASGGMTSGIWHCHEHFDDAMAQKPRPKVAA